MCISFVEHLQFFTRVYLNGYSCKCGCSPDHFLCRRDGPRGGGWCARRPLASTSTADAAARVRPPARAQKISFLALERADASCVSAVCSQIIICMCAAYACCKNNGNVRVTRTHQIMHNVKLYIAISSQVQMGIFTMGRWCCLSYYSHNIQHGTKPSFDFNYMADQNLVLALRATNFCVVFEVGYSCSYVIFELLDNFMTW